MNLTHTTILDSSLIFWMNLLTSIAYVAITIMMILLLKSSPLLKSLFGGHGISPQRQQVSQVTLGLSSLFGLFIFLCGLTHLITALIYLHPYSRLLNILHHILMTLCGLVSIATAFMMLKLYSNMESILKNLEVTDAGTVTHLENYIIQVVDMFQESIIVLSSNFEIIRGNRATSYFFGNQFLGLNIKSCIHPEDFNKVYDTVLGVRNNYSGRPEVIEYRVQVMNSSSFRSGSNSMSNSNMAEVSYRWVESTLTRNTAMYINSTTSDELIMITRDIEERKQTEFLQNQINASKALEEINAAKLRYITCTAHDLKTPLQSFSFAIELLHGTLLSDEQSEYVRNAEVSIDLMRMTISQAMDIARSLSGTVLQPRRGTVNLTDLLKRAQIIIRGYSKQVPIYFNVSSNISNYIITDEEWLWQIILNYLTNACKYTETGWIKLNLSLAENNMLLIEVIDTGIGLKSSIDLDHIFILFGQMQKGQSTGTGLGLYGTKIHVDALGGKCGARRNASNNSVSSSMITTNNDDHNGSTFWCEIPYVPDCLNSDSNVISPETMLPENIPMHHENSPPISTISNDHNGTTFQLNNQSINNINNNCNGLTAIIVDDSTPILKMLTKILLNVGFIEVESYCNGSQGLEALKRKEVDFVFSDVQMPVMTGPEMVERFRIYENEALRLGKRKKRQIIIAVTANGEESLQGSDGAIFDHLCPKPLNMKKLKNILDKYQKTEMLPLKG